MSKLLSISVQVRYRTTSGLSTDATFKSSKAAGAAPGDVLAAAGSQLAVLAALEGRSTAFLEAVREAIHKTEEQLVRSE